MPSLARFEDRIWARLAAFGRRLAPLVAWTVPVGRNAGRLYSWLERTPVAAPLCLLMTLASFVVLRSIDLLLKAMHVPGGASYGTNSLVQLFPSRADPAKVVDTWSQWAAQTKGAKTALGPHGLVHLYLAVDSFAFVPFYTALLAIVVVRLRAHVAGARLRYRVLSFAIGAAIALALVDLGENVCQLFLLHGVTGFGWPGSILWLIKWLLLGAVVLAIAAEAIRLALESRDWHRERVRQLVICRLQVVVALLFVAVFFGPATLADQATDVVRRLADDWLPLPLLLALLVVLSAVMLGTSVTLVVNSGRLTRRGGDQYRILARALVVCAVAFLFVFLLRHVGVFSGGVGLYVAVGIAAGVCALSLPLVGTQGLRPPAATEDTFVPALLTVTPMVAIGLGILSTAVGDLIYRSGGRAWGLLAVGVVLTLAGFALYALIRWRLAALVGPEPRDTAALPLRRFGLYGSLALALALVAMVPAVFWPWFFARAVDGTIGVLLAFSIALLCIGFVLVLLAEIFEPPPVFLYLRLRRIPVLSLMLLWFVLSSFLDPIGFHAIRLTHGAVPQPKETIDRAFVRWRVNAASAVPAKSTARKPVPLVFVSAVGGGIRAAYWTSLVLQCLVDKRAGCDLQGGPAVPSKSIFLASGASGGSLGLVTYIAHRADPHSAADADWPSHLEDDALAPTLARMLFLDLPNSFSRFQRFDDRAAILERSWESSWKRGQLGKALYSLYQKHDVWPRLLLNGTSVVDGCRVETSPLATSSLLRGDSGSALVDGCLSLLRYELFPGGQGVHYVPPEKRTWFLGGTKDVGSFLCADAASDVRLSTAALLSARFPFVSPSGRVECNKGPSLYVVDGGYWDNTATESIIEAFQHLLPAIERYNSSQQRVCVIPTLLQIDNHYAQPAGPKDAARPKEAFVPTSTLGNVRNGRDADAREEAALLFSGRSFARGQKALVAGGPLERVAHIYPHAHPGVEAPLGWTLSAFARQDLLEQLTSDANLNQIARVRDWFRPGISCKIAG